MNIEKELLNKKHNREKFDCGVDSLNHYFKFQASQDVKRKLSVCFVFSTNNIVKGFYTLSSGSIPLEDVPKKYSKRYPKSYSKIPIVLLGRLAVDNNFKGKGLGEFMLIDALQECYEVSKAKIGAVAIIVDPVNEDAENFYKKYGFIKLADSGKMFLPMKTIKKLFDDAG